MKRIAALALSSILLLLAPDAGAQANPAGADSVAKAKMLFDAGAQAYSRGQFAKAIQVFNEAYRLAPRPGITFSIAQAHRRQYYLTKKPEHLREAIRHYREYAAKVEQGGRSADVAEALAELEPTATRLGIDTSGPISALPPTPVAEVKSLAQLTVMSQTKGAMVSLDGGKPVEAPLIQDVPAGNHRIKVTAEGFLAEEREYPLTAGSVVPLDITLRERPALLNLQCDGGADVSVDGRLVATTPLLKPLALSSGKHFIAVTKSGHRPLTQEIDVARGETKTLTFSLDMTTQRVAAYSFLIVGGASVLGGAFAGLSALSDDEEAEIILRESEKGNSTRLAEYQAAAKSRDEARLSALIALGTGTVLGATGLLLYIFDSPPTVTGPSRQDDSPKNSPNSAPGLPSIEMGAAPVWVPGYAGAAIVGRF